MNYSQAEEITNVYTGLLINKKSNCIYKFKAINDAMRLMIAYRVYINSSESGLEIVQKYTSAAESALMFYPMLFDEPRVYGDNVTSTVNSIESFKQWQEEETLELFLNYCLSIKDNRLKYWECIYLHLSIECNDSDNKDKIYSELIRNREQQNNSLEYKPEKEITKKKFDWLRIFKNW